MPDQNLTPNLTNEIVVIPELYADSILAFDEPFPHGEKLIDMTKSQRKMVYLTYKPTSQKPTKTNQWIWFGARQEGTRIPRFSDKSVVRLLYNDLVSPLENRVRLSTVVSNPLVDVNPFKYQRLTALTKLIAKNQKGELALLIEKLNQDPSAYEQVAAHKSEMVEALVNACENQIRKDFLEGILDSKPMFVDIYSKTAQFPSMIVMKALERTSDLKWV